MPNSKLYNVKTTLTDGTVIDSGTIEVPEGQTGATGKDALAYSGSIASGTGTIAVGQSVLMNTSGFNRQPASGDKFIGYMSLNNSTYIVAINITSVSGANTSGTIATCQQINGKNAPVAKTMIPVYGLVNPIQPGSIFSISDTAFDETLAIGDKVIVPFNVRSNTAPGTGPFSAYCEVTSHSAAVYGITVLSLLGMPGLICRSGVSLTAKPATQATFNMNAASFNRQPIEGDEFEIWIGVNQGDYSGYSYRCTAIVTASANPIFTCQIKSVGVEVAPAKQLYRHDICWQHGETVVNFQFVNNYASAYTSTNSDDFVRLRNALNDAGYNGLNMWGSSRQLMATGMYGETELGVVMGVFANSNTVNTIYIQYFSIEEALIKYENMAYNNDFIKDTVTAL